MSDLKLPEGWEKVVETHLPKIIKDYKETLRIGRTRWHQDRTGVLAEELLNQLNYLFTCTSDFPDNTLKNYKQHEFIFDFDIDNDHGDEAWICKNCKKRWYKEGPDY